MNALFPPYPQEPFVRLIEEIMNSPTRTPTSPTCIRGTNVISMIRRNENNGALFVMQMFNNFYTIQCAMLRRGCARRHVESIRPEAFEVLRER